MIVAFCTGSTLPRGIFSNIKIHQKISLTASNNWTTVFSNIACFFLRYFDILDLASFFFLVCFFKIYKIFQRIKLQFKDFFA